MITKQNSQKKPNPTKIASTASLITSTIPLFATILALMNPDIKSITPLLLTLYGTLGYTISLAGSLLGALYIGIDTFIIVWLFIWIYNKIL